MSSLVGTPEARLPAPLKDPDTGSGSSDGSPVEEPKIYRASVTIPEAPGTPVRKPKQRGKAVPKRRYISARGGQHYFEQGGADAHVTDGFNYGRLSESELFVLLKMMGKDTIGNHEDLSARLATAVRQDQANRRQQARETYMVQAAKFREELAVAQRNQKSHPEGALAQKIAQQLRDECDEQQRSSAVSWSSKVSGAVLPDDTDEPQSDPDFESVAMALNSIAVPVNTSRGNVKVKHPHAQTSRTPDGPAQPADAMPRAAV
jgi:hypothetical protein